MLFRLPIRLVNIFNDFGFYEVLKRMPMDPILVDSVFHCVREIEWSSADSSDEFASYNYRRLLCKATRLGE